MVTYLKRVQYEKGKESTNFTVEKPDKHCLSKAIKGTSTLIGHLIVSTLIKCDENGT